MNILVTGGCGFIGSNFIRYWNSNFRNDKIINLDKLTYAGNKLNLLDIENDKKYEFIKGDICNSYLVDKILKKNNPIFIVNFAAESHVDRSIAYPEKFINTNILGTFKLLNSISIFAVKRKIYQLLKILRKVERTIKKQKRTVIIKSSWDEL